PDHTVALPRSRFGWKPRPPPASPPIRPIRSQPMRSLGWRAAPPSWCTRRRADSAGTATPRARRAWLHAPARSGWCWSTCPPRPRRPTSPPPARASLRSSWAAMDSSSPSERRRRRVSRRRAPAAALAAVLVLISGGCASPRAAGDACPASLPALVDLRSLDPSPLLEVRYAGEDNFTGTRLAGYEQARALLTPEAAAALERVARRLAVEGLGLKVWDAYRPRRASRHMVEWAERTDNRWVIEEGYVAPESGHNRGA